MNVPRPLRRWWLAALPVWHHPSYRLPLTSPVMDANRADRALTWALDAAVVRSDAVRYPEEVSWDDVALVHDDAYLAELDRPGVVAAIVGADQARISVREVVETWRRATAGTVEAVRHVLAHGGRAANLLGGFHHAERDKGGGFCALNDVAIAVASARRGGFTGRVRIVDLDAHPPDGLVACLGDDPGVEIRSLSVASHWSVPPSPRLIDARVGTGARDGEYLRAVDALLARADRVDLVIYLAGADPLAGDALGGMNVSAEGLRARDRRVLASAGATPLVMVPAGGYHPNSWRVLGATLAELVGVHEEIPPDYDPMARRSRAIAHALDPAALGEPADVLLTEAELLGSLGVPESQEPRFLGYYTRHGLEHALSAHGYFTTLRRLGFAELRVELEPGTSDRRGTGPDRMRVTAAVGGERAALVDLSASIREIGGFRVLFLEWLELTDPRAPFTQGRPALPGQRKPGLGLAEETLQLLVRAAERLELAGMAFVPAHYHVAWMARASFVVLDPELRGRFRALVRVLSGVPLAEATRRMASPGVPTEDGEVAKWIPTEMITPFDERLAGVIARGEPAAAAAEERWSVRLVG